MITKDLLTFIKKQLRTGASKDDIVQVLSAGTWDPIDVEQAFAALIPFAPSLVVDYGMSFEDMISAGAYDRRDADISPEMFPVKGHGKAEFEATLFHFGRDIFSKDVLGFIGSVDWGHPWKPASIEHLLAFGAAYPKEQCKYEIAGLGSVSRVESRYCTPTLFRVGDDRHLRLRIMDGGVFWQPDFRFLAVRRKGGLFGLL